MKLIEVTNYYDKTKYYINLEFIRHIIPVKEKYISAKYETKVVPFLFFFKREERVLVTPGHSVPSSNTYISTKNNQYEVEEDIHRVLFLIRDQG